MKRPAHGLWIALAVLTLAVAASAQIQRLMAEQRKSAKPPVRSSFSQGAEPWIEWEQRMNADQRLTAFGPDLLGDQIDPNTGSIASTSSRSAR